MGGAAVCGSGKEIAAEGLGGERALGMRLRPYFGRLDYKYIAEWVNDERTHGLWCGNLMPYPMSEESLEALLEKDAREWDGHGFMATENDGTPIGFLCYSVNTADNGGFLKFVLLNPSLRGRGYGTRMMKLALKYAFDITGVDFVGINVFHVNQGARRCYEKAGFVLQTVTEAVYRHGDEVWNRCHMVAGRESRGRQEGCRTGETLCPAQRPAVEPEGDQAHRPAYLYHGSQYRFDVVIPHEASGECESESRRAIYAAETVDAVIPFALPIRWYPDTPDGKRSFNCQNGVVQLQYGSLDPHGVGYIYKLKSQGFEKIDGWQWISAQEAVPEEIMEIRVSDYLDRVVFSEEARAINDFLYGTGEMKE